MKRNTIGFLLLVFLTTFPALMMAQEPDSNQDPVSTSDQDIQVPESYLERVKRVSTIMELSLQESIRMALANNLEIAIENYCGAEASQILHKLVGDPRAARVARPGRTMV